MFLFGEKCVYFLIFFSCAGVELGGKRFLGNLIVQLVQSGVCCFRSGGQEMVFMPMKSSPLLSSIYSPMEREELC